MENRVVNPCIGYCKLNEEGICQGCGRTEDERTDWVFLSISEQKAICDRAKQRLAQITKP